MHLHGCGWCCWRTRKIPQFVRSAIMRTNVAEYERMNDQDPVLPPFRIARETTASQSVRHSHLLLGSARIDGLPGAPASMAKVSCAAGAKTGMTQGKYFRVERTSSPRMNREASPFTWKRCSSLRGVGHAEPPTLVRKSSRGCTGPRVAGFPQRPANVHPTKIAGVGSEDGGRTKRLGYRSAVWNS